MLDGTRTVGPEVIGIGIDIGMTYSGAAICYRLPTGYMRLDVIPVLDAMGEPKFPSQVFVGDGGSRITVGNKAAENEANSVPGKLYSLFKRDIGTPWSDETTGKKVTPSFLTAEVMKAVKLGIDTYLRENHLSPPVIRYAFSHPGVWSDVKLRDMTQAIKDAGFTNYVTIDEPIAAALGASNAAANPQLLASGQYTFVCDLGGGTLDLAVISVNPDGAIRMQAPTEGNARLGMSNIDKWIGLLLYMRAGYTISSLVDQVLAEPICYGKELEEAWQTIPDAWRSELLRQCEDLKRQVCKFWNKLSSFPAVLPGTEARPVLLTKTDLLPLFERMNASVKEAAIRYINELRDKYGINEWQITHLVVTGGGSALPNIGDGLQTLFPSAQRLPIEVDTAISLVQRGAALYARNPALLEERRCNSSFGVKSYTRQQPTYEGEIETDSVQKDGQTVTYYAYYDTFLTRGTTVPADGVVHNFTPLRPNQSAVTFQVLQGEDKNPRHNVPVGDATVKLPREAPDTYIVHCKFYLGEDGFIHAYAWDPKTQERSEEVVFAWQLAPDDD